MSKKEKWEIEPDYLHCIDQETGYFYYIYRDLECKHLCGYVEIPNTHKVYWLSYMDELFYDIDVHGGVAYTGTLENPYAKETQKTRNLLKCDASLDASLQKCQTCLKLHAHFN